MSCKAADKKASRFLITFRPDLLQTLFDHATNAGVEISFKHNVTAIDESDPSVAANNGTIFRADLVIAADGMFKSAIYFYEADFYPKAYGRVSGRNYFPRLIQTLLCGQIQSSLLTCPAQIWRATRIYPNYITALKSTSGWGLVDMWRVYPSKRENCTVYFFVIVFLEMPTETGFGSSPET
jgi:hypothetical protein